MCNDIEQAIAWQAYCEAMQMLAWDVPTIQSDLDLPVRDHVHIRDVGAVIRPAGNSVELTSMRWGFPPSNPRGTPVFNFKSEGRRFRDSNRCLIPASAFFEFTGAKSPKTRHRFTPAKGPFLCIAGIWRPANDNEPPDFTMLTTEPGPDVAPYHNRQVVVLAPEDWPSWLYLAKSEEELLKPSPAGSFLVETETRSRQTG
ncbi:MAG TPA: SOS response-associated peptidase family protein [Caulobacteraceae bacterium]|jgi:putative SOS response-associated peptidase YedK|nr:SOS response-associated peptidase family protein [Caulobacteraceae bacterium]